MAHLKLIEDGTILDVVFDGPSTFSARSETLATIRPFMERQPVGRVLVDFTDASVTHDEVPGSAGNFTADLALMPFPAGTAIAYVNAPLLFSDDPVEWVSQATGIRTKRFYSREEALAWLTSLT
jgi:hypothetical protein